MGTVREQAARLDASRIVDAALTIAARDGAPAVTMRRLGAELGVDPTAFYRHFRTKDDLLAAMAERLLEREVDVFEPGPDWRENLRRLYWAGWRVYRGHPGFAETIARLPEDVPTLARIADLILAELRRAGLSRRDAALYYHSSVDLIAGTGLFIAIAPRLAEAEGRDEMRRELATLPATSHPAVHEVGDELYPPVEDVFTNSVELMLDAIQFRSGKSDQRREEER
jgi:AcrR family transcriptional regulator